MFLHGGHVSHFQPKGERPVLWLSGASRFEHDRPIRGGVPVCFPWFGPKAEAPEAPMHGFARILAWAVGRVTRELDGRLEAALELTPEAAARGGFAAELGLTLTVSVGRSLRLALAVRNEAAPARFEEALHSYFAVSDVRNVRVLGLEGTGLPRQDRGDGAQARGTRAGHDLRRNRPRLPRHYGNRDDRGPRLGPARRDLEDGLGDDGAVEPMESPRRARCRTSATTSGPACCASRPPTWARRR